FRKLLYDIRRSSEGMSGVSAYRSEEVQSDYQYNFEEYPDLPSDLSDCRGNEKKDPPLIKRTYNRRSCVSVRFSCRLRTSRGCRWLARYIGQRFPPIPWHESGIPVLDRCNRSTSLRIFVTHPCTSREFQ